MTQQRIIILQGPPGCGKSTLAQMICEAIGNLVFHRNPHHRLEAMPAWGVVNCDAVVFKKKHKAFYKEMIQFSKGAHNYVIVTTQGEVPKYLLKHSMVFQISPGTFLLKGEKAKLKFHKHA